MIVGKYSLLRSLLGLIFKSKFYKTTSTLVKLSENYRFNMIYHKITYLTLILLQNYRFKVKYRKKLDLITKLSKLQV